ncbi:MAG: hydroxymethylglutaryl-CoA reductase, degradative [Candidatus Heimdallarchaeaceae archaeon]
MSFSSRIPRFYNKSVEERKKILAKLTNLTKEEIKILEGEKIPLETLNIMIENVVGCIALPLGIATNFIVNGEEYLVPMAIEESSVVAAASFAARMTRKHGGFFCEYSGSINIGQIQILGVPDFTQAKRNIEQHKQELLDLANSTNKVLLELGGGAKDITLREIKGEIETYLVLHLFVDTKDAMGANAVNTMLEKIKEKIETLTLGNVLLKIISNFADQRIVKVRAVFDKEELGGEQIVENILKAYDFANNDVYRCTTHNKGIMNGIISVLLATGNDTRAAEAGAHAYASRGGKYRSLSRFEKDEEGNLVGFLELPLAVGILGGAISTHPAYGICLKIMKISTVEEFSCVVGAVGLAQNVAALRALSAEGIQKGHMVLHARNMAVNVGAIEDEIEKVANQLIEENNVTFDRAKEILENLRKKL